MARGLNPFFQIQSLRDFNQKFGPEWVPRSVVIDDVSDLPRIALLYASVEGFLELPILGRALRAHLDAHVVHVVDVPGARVADHLAVARLQDHRPLPERRRQRGEAEHAG